MRKAIKKPLTTRGLELMIKKLYKLTTDIDEQIEILNNSIMNNWQGIFPLKQESKTNKKEILTILKSCGRRQEKKMKKQETAQIITLLAGNYNSIAEKIKNKNS